MIKTFQPAEVADMNHTTNAGSQLNKNTIRSNVLHETCMFAAFGKLRFNRTPWIFAKLFNRQAHLAIVFIQRYNLSLIFITQLENCLLYTSDAADERSSVDLGGRRI